MFYKITFHFFLHSSLSALHKNVQTLSLKLCHDVKRNSSIESVKHITDLEANSYHHPREQAREKLLPGLVISPDDTRHTGGNNHVSYLSLAARQVMQALSYGVISSAKGRPPPHGTLPHRCGPTLEHSPLTCQPSAEGIQCYNANSPTRMGFLHRLILSPPGEGGKDWEGRKVLFIVLCSYC